MSGKYAASVQGVTLRITRLKADQSPDKAQSYVTQAFIRTSFTPEYEAGDEITEKAADGTICVSYKAPDTLKRVNLEIAVCDPDPEITQLLSGGLMLVDNPGVDGVDKVLGWASGQVGEDPSGNGVSVEVWSRAVIDGKPASEDPFFHWVFPFVKTRLSGDRVVENGLLATAFEGYGVGNIEFQGGPDGEWNWPQATDRPYLYARDSNCPTGRGWFDYSTAAAATTVYDALAKDATLAVSVDITADTSGTEKHDSTAEQVGDPAAFKANAAAVTGGTAKPKGAPTGATAGTPGAFVPAGSTVPADLTALQALNIGSGAAWATGENVALGTGTAYWNGTAWVTGVAP